MPQIDPILDSATSTRDRSSWIPSQDRLLLLIPATVLMGMPILVDAIKLNCAITPDCYNNPNPGFYLKILSAFLGSICLALALIPMPPRSWQRWALRAWIVVAGTVLVVVGAFYADFAREFTF